MVNHPNRKLQTINDLDPGCYVQGLDGSISRVSICVHGKKYYGYVADNIDDAHLHIKQITARVNDSDEDHIPCCG